MKRNPSVAWDVLKTATLGLTMIAVIAGCANEEEQGGFSMPPTPVETAEATQETVVDRFEAVGTIEAGDAITVVTEISAIVTDLAFQEGSAVRRGDLIARLDDTQLRAEVERAEAIREQNRIQFERIKSVVDAGAGAPQDLDDARADLKVAEADLALAKARLSKTRISAPFDGILGVRRVSHGAYLRAGDPITDLAKISELRILFAAPERVMARLTKGSRVTVSAPAYPGLEVTGTIDVVEPVLNPTTRNAMVVARVVNPAGKLRPGMSANVSAVLSTRENALTIPSEAVFVEGEQSLVYVIHADSTVHRRNLSLGTRLADAVEVVTGLSPGDRVVRAGHQKLFEGAKVMPVQPGEPANPGRAE
ncbi:MAG: efflux RND transporter periplasmic adaptor subunit, partial [Candidatus Eisenbacteria bacterium]|nr:efflux RND transporter periplasmic adaptor subunit [Candidatus Eisenbacteria bacterium]